MFKFDLLDLNNGSEIVKIGEKFIYNTDGNITASKWVEDITDSDKVPCVPTKNGITIHYGDNVKNTWMVNSIGYFHNNANNIQYNPNYVGVYSTVFGSAHGVCITKGNLFRVFNLFTARKLIIPNWINQKDEYLVPNEQHEHYSQFTNDSIVYSLFNNSSQQSSLRQITYKDQLWDIKNEFFWMSANQMKELGDQHGYDELYNDARTSSDRYVYNLLFGEERIYDKLSPDAKLVLDKAIELTINSMNMRQIMADNQNHLNSWDAGYAQLKLVWKEYFPEEFKEFRQLYKNLEDRMRPLVYELGFLMK